MAREHSLTLGQYLDLDDHVLLETINAWRECSDPLLADLCKRLRARDLFKTIELYSEWTDSKHREHAHQVVRDIARDAGLDPDFYTALDLAVDTPYSDDSSLAVIFPNTRPRRPAEVSFVLDRLRDETLTRVRLLFASELREKVHAALFTEDSAEPGVLAPTQRNG